MARMLLRPRYIGVALALALMLGCCPSALAAPVPSMATDVAQPTGRAAREAEVQRLLAEQQVADALAEAGLDAEQIRTRLDRLSDEQLEQLAEQLETIQAGEGTAILLGLLAIVLIGVLIYMQIEAA